MIFYHHWTHTANPGSQKALSLKRQDAHRILEQLLIEPQFHSIIKARKTQEHGGHIPRRPSGGQSPTVFSCPLNHTLNIKISISLLSISTLLVLKYNNEASKLMKCFKFYYNCWRFFSDSNSFTQSLTESLLLSKC